MVYLQYKRLILENKKVNFPQMQPVILVNSNIYKIYFLNTLVIFRGGGYEWK